MQTFGHFLPNKMEFYLLYGAMRRLCLHKNGLLTYATGNRLSGWQMSALAYLPQEATVFSVGPYCNREDRNYNKKNDIHKSVCHFSHIFSLFLLYPPMHGGLGDICVGSFLISVSA